MKARWLFIISLVLATVALCLEFSSVGAYRDATKLLTHDFMANVQAPNPAADILLHHSQILFYTALPIACASTGCLLLSRRKKEPVAGWRWPVAVLLLLYLYFVLGPG